MHVLIYILCQHENNTIYWNSFFFPFGHNRQLKKKKNYFSIEFKIEVVEKPRMTLWIYQIKNRNYIEKYLTLLKMKI